MPGRCRDQNTIGQYHHDRHAHWEGRTSWYRVERVAILGWGSFLSMRWYSNTTWIHHKRRDGVESVDHSSTIYESDVSSYPRWRRQIFASRSVRRSSSSCSWAKSQIPSQLPQDREWWFVPWTKNAAGAADKARMSDTVEHFMVINRIRRMNEWIFIKENSCRKWIYVLNSGSDKTVQVQVQRYFTHHKYYSSFVLSIRDACQNLRLLNLSLAWW